MTIGAKSTSQTECRAYTLGGVTLTRITAEKDLGVLVDESLSFDQHIAMKVKKANSVLAVIRKTFVKITKPILSNVFKGLVRPHLEYCNQIWHPSLVRQKKLIEDVQRRATRLMPSLRNLSYPERLRELNLPSLEYRRKRGAMIETFKLLKGLYDRAAFNEMFQFSESEHRGNKLHLKSVKSRLRTRTNFLSIRVVNDWNSLSENVVSSHDINQFKTRLDYFWKEKMYETPDAGSGKAQH